jgi:hypothetical protein
MNGLTDLYERIATGMAPPSLADETAAALLDLARAAVEAEDGDWEAAIRVAATVGGWRASGLLRGQVRRGSFERAAMAIEWAPYAGLDGEGALCQALEAADEALVLRALCLLTAHRCAAGTGRARRLLGHASLAVRAAAVEYLGLVAGPAVYCEIQPLIAVPELHDAVRLALERIDGRAARPEALPWPRPPLQADVVVEPPAQAPEGSLPEDPERLLALLGCAGAEHRGALVQALGQLAAPRLAAALRPLVAAAPEDVAVGACRFVGATAQGRWRLPVRRLLDHASARVRLTAAQALAVMGVVADRAALERAARDPNPEVRAAVAEALARIAEREG